MKKEGITLYCKSEKWAVFFESKYAFTKAYGYDEVQKYVGKHYTELNVITYHFYFHKEEVRKVYTSNYIIRDHNGDPVTVSDLPYRYLKKTKKAKIKEEYGRAVPGTGIAKRSKFKNVDCNSGKGFLKQCSEKELETEDGVKIPPIRQKVRKRTFTRKMWEYYDSPLELLKEKSWKKYRKNQWK